MVKSSIAVDAPDEEVASDEAAAPNSADFCPVGRALDLIGARWTLVLVRHLLTGPRRFQELRDLTGIAPRLLSIRLTQLVERGLVEKIPAGNRSIYGLTAFGKTLDPIVREVAIWWVRHAMPHAGPFRDTTPAAVIEAVTFLLKRDRPRDSEDSYDVRMKMTEGGGWTVEFVTSPATAVDSERNAAQPGGAASSSTVIVEGTIAEAATHSESPSAAAASTPSPGDTRS